MSKQTMRSSFWGAVGVTLLAVLGVSVPASAGPSPSGAVASYNGAEIDLAEGWEGAQYCAVHSADDVRCYDTENEMVEDENANVPSMVAESSYSQRAASDCPSGLFTNEWYCLFEDANFGGRMLKFKATGCQSLANFGFSNQASSWVMTLAQTAPTYDSATCTTSLWTAQPNASSTYVGATKNDRASSINIQP